MDDNDKHGARAEIGLQHSEAITVIIQPTESNLNQCRVPSIVAANYGLSVDMPTYCTDNYKIRENIKHEPLEATHEDNACRHQLESVYGHLTTGLQTVAYGHLHQEITEKPVIRSIENSSQETTSTQGDSEFIEIKQEIKSVRDGYGGNTDLTRYWVTCPGGILKEVKAEHKPKVSAILPDEDCGENNDEKERVQSEKTHTNVQEIRCSLKPPSTRGCRGVKPFIVDMGGKSDVDSSHLNLIDRTDTSVKPFTCVKSFARINSIKVHKRRHTGVKSFTCDICGKSFVYSSQLKAHKRTHTGVKPFTCDICGKSFIDSAHLKRHERIHTGVKLFICDLCGKSFISSSHLRSHERTHTGVKPFNCSTCGMSYSRTGYLKIHERIHTGVKPFTCIICGKSFVASSNLIVHKRTHTGVKPFTCIICGKSFIDSSNLKVHKITHTGVKPFTCATCGRSFAHAHSLKAHERTHTGVKPFTCSTCGRSFAHANSLNVHERTHTGVKPFTCDICGKSFGDSSHIKVHKRTHTGVKPFTCGTCGKSFAASNQLKIHGRTHIRKFSSPDMA